MAPSALPPRSVLSTHRRTNASFQDWSDNRASVDLRKNLAALLIDKKTQKTVAMGYEAEEKYTKAQERQEDDQYMYFQHFKPYLYS